MIEYIKGGINLLTPTSIVIDTGSIGYKMHISLFTFEKIRDMKQVSLLAYTHIREDAHTMFGFYTDTERVLFLQLISVSGVGTSTAQILLSGMQPDAIRTAILSDDEVAFSKIKGIGPKTAKRIILDLKDKVKKEGLENDLISMPRSNKIYEEAFSALLALGFVKINVSKAIQKVTSEQPTIESVEQLIKLALKQLS
jgi:holliday junction DNA helicase RuvA